MDIVKAMVVHPSECIGKDFLIAECRTTRRLCEKGSFEAKSTDRGRQRTTKIADLEENILARVEEDPKVSTRRLALNLAVPKSIVHDVLREQFLHPYHLQKVQDLLQIDLEKRLAFC